MATAAQQISQIYVGYFNRAPDPAGLQYWINQLNNGMPLGEIADYFATEQETLDLYPYLREPDLNSVDDFINQIYGNLFNRPADAAGMTFWKAQLESGAVSEGEFIAAIANGATGEGRLVLDNKVSVGVYFATELSQNNVVWDANALDAAYQALAGVTLDPASVIDAKAEINYFVENGAWPGTPGETFTLTAGVDTIVGTAGNDLVQGVVSDVAGTTQTLNPLDNIDGGAGVNTLALVLNSAANDLIFPVATTIKNIQNVELVAANATSTFLAGELNSADFGAQVESIWQIGASSDIILALDGQTAGFRGNTAALVNNGTVVAGAGVASVQVALDGVLDGQVVTFGGAAPASLTNVTVSGSVIGGGAVGIDTTSANVAVDTVNLALSTSGVVTLTVDTAVVKTVDASASTGNLTIDATAIASLGNFLGGSGNDILSIDIANLTSSALVVNGGAGADTIAVDSAVAAAANVTVALTGGAGVDTFSFASLANVVAEGNFASSLITITDFEAADQLRVTGARDVLSTTELGNISGAATLAAAIDLAGSYTNGGEFSLFNYEGDAYLLHSVAGGDLANGDGLVKIAGFSVEEFNSGNLIFA